MKKIKKKASHHGEGLQKFYNWFKEKVPERPPVSSFEEVPRQVAGGKGDWESLGFPPSRVLRPAALQSEVKLNILSSFYAWHRQHFPRSGFVKAWEGGRSEGGCSQARPFLTVKSTCLVLTTTYWRQ